jgi:acetyl esterase/lipase
MTIFVVAAILATSVRPVIAQEATPATPSRAATPDYSFYEPPANVPAEPGQLLRSEPFTLTVPDGAQAWRILYTTTREDGTPAVASGLVLAATNLLDGPRPVIAWTHGTTGIARQCAPSLLDSPFGAGALPALDQIIAEGWVLVATDYVGLGTPGPHPYLVGEVEARSALDAVRAAMQMPELTLDNKVVVWGHSQGGHAALWTGQIAPTYAPDVSVVGVVALAPASDLKALFERGEGTLFGDLISSLVVTAYSEVYPDVSFDELVNPDAQPFVQVIVGGCTIPVGPDAAKLLAAATQLPRPLFVSDPYSGAYGQRLVENTPSDPIAAPLFVGQGLDDSAVLPDVQAAYVQARCDAGQVMTYHTYAGRDHGGVVASDSPLIPDLLAFTKDAFAGNPQASPQASGCETIAG